MKKFLLFACAVLFVFSASATPATAFYYEATDVMGVGTIYYDADFSDGINPPPRFSFIADSGTVDENLGCFTPGDYTVEIMMEGLWVDNYNLPDFYAAAGPFYIPGLPPLSGHFGNLSYKIDPYSGFAFSYDFGPDNFDVNLALLLIDREYGGEPYGVMDADIKWDKFRVDLNPVNPVPEPATMLLFGLGILGLAGVSRKKLQ